MEMASVSATDFVRNFAQVMDTFTRKRRSFLVKRGRNSLARVTPVEVSGATFEDLRDVQRFSSDLFMEADRTDFEEDLERARGESFLPQNKWV